MNDISIASLMTTTMALVTPDTCLKQVVRKMYTHRHSCAIIGENGVPSGIVTERDLARVLDQILTDVDVPEHRVDEIMAHELHTVHIDQSLFDALAITRAERIRHLPVIDDQDKLVGLLTQTDLVNAYFHTIERQRDIIERAIESYTGELREANKRLHALSMEDALLGIGNRRAMEVDLDHTHAALCRYHHPYPVMLIDLDHFKQYNDHYGHLEGDRCLQKTCRIFAQSIRKSDRLYRYGGEEFLLLLPHTELRHAATLAKRLLENLRHAAMPHFHSPHKIVTMSAGTASCSVATCDQMSWQDVVERADKALY